MVASASSCRAARTSGVVIRPVAFTGFSATAARRCAVMTSRSACVGLHFDAAGQLLRQRRPLRGSRPGHIHREPRQPGRPRLLLDLPDLLDEPLHVRAALHTQQPRLLAETPKLFRRHRKPRVTGRRWTCSEVSSSATSPARSVRWPSGSARIVRIASASGDFASSWARRRFSARTPSTPPRTPSSRTSHGPRALLRGQLVQPVAHPVDRPALMGQQPQPGPRLGAADVTGDAAGERPGRGVLP
jgi:hypothetical protein